MVNHFSFTLPNLFLIWFGFVFLIITLLRILFFFKNRKVVQEEGREDILERGIEDPQPHRPIGSEEQLILEQKYKLPKWVANNLFWLIPAFIVLDILFLVTLFFIPFLLPIMLVEIYLLLKGKEAKPYLLDIQSPIFKVQGHALKETTRRKNSTGYYPTVRKVKFTEENYPGLSNFFFTNCRSRRSSYRV